MKRHTTKQFVIFFLIKKNNRNEFHLKKQPSYAVALFMWGGVIQGRRRSNIGLFLRGRDFSIIFNYGYGAVSVDFGCGSDKIIFPYG